MSISESIRRRIPNGLKPFLLVAYRAYRWIYEMAIRLYPGNLLRIAQLRKARPLKLNIGSGKARLSGWVNIDIESGADIIVDVTRGLPFYDNSVDFVYCEHLLEHLTHKQGQEVLKEFRRCLRKQGVVRIAMPDLDHIIQKYNTDWKNQDWLTWPQFKFIETKGQMINICFRSWGHKFLYNEEDLRDQLAKAGFQNIIRCDKDKSDRKELCNLETRVDSKLIMEAEKR